MCKDNSNMCHSTCSNCDNEIELKAIKYIKQPCPICGKLTRACSMCTEEEYSSGCNQCENIK